MKYKDLFCVNKYYNIKFYCRYRFDSIPRTGKNYYYTNLMRKPKTRQELKQSFAYPKFTRSKRKKNYIPTEWDDNIRSDHNNNNWKKCTKRKHQWK